MTRRRDWARAGVTGALVLALGTGGIAAVADPVTDDDVADARRAVASTAAQVATIELRLAQQSAALDEAWIAVAQAAEDYTAAVVARDDAVAAAREAAERAAQAAAEVDAARDELGVIALAAYRSSGSLDSLGAMLTSEGYEEYVARTEAIAHVGTRADRALQRVEAAEVVGSTLAARAEAALAEAEDAAAAAEEALQRAEELQRAAEAEVARIEAEREQLIAELAALRQTSVELERQRQAQLEAERQARADAAARGQHGGAGAPSATPGTPSAPPANPGTPQQPATPPSTPPPAPPAPSDPPQQPANPPANPPSTPAPPPASDPYGLGTGTTRGTAEQGAAAVAWALAQVGKPYLYGGSGPDAFDCSGLTMRAWQNAGVNINRTSRDQYRAYLKISYDQMRPGDLIAWGNNPADPGSVYHVAMYIGNGQMVEAPRAGIPVRVVSIRWQGTMPYAVRP